MSETKVKKTSPVKVKEVSKNVNSASKAVSKTVKKVEIKVAEKSLKSKEVSIPKSVVKKPATLASYKASVISVSGEEKGSMNLPSDVFGLTPNKKLISQAVRVYLANQRQGTASTKTRSEVVGSTRKIYRQKGTGRARHGANKAPLFVGGGIALGPKPRDFSLKLPQKMRKIALFSALSEKAKEGAIRVIEGDFSGKTKEVSSLFKKLSLAKKDGKLNRVLLVVDNNSKARQGARNIKGVDVENVMTLSTYPVVVNKNIFFLKEAIEVLSSKKSKKEEIAG